MEKVLTFKKQRKQALDTNQLSIINYSVDRILKSETNSKFTFIDLFAGIGGFRIAMENLGGKCVFSSEWNLESKMVYRENFGEIPFGDITKEEVKNNIPEKYDLLCAGFPCQPFSKGGSQSGFSDTRGTLFFEICTIIEKHRPKFLFLENVANLVSHDNGNTYKVIEKNLKNLGYAFPIKPLILSPDQFGIPMLRPRVYIPCVRNDILDKLKSNLNDFETELRNQFQSKTQSIDIFLETNVESDLSKYEINILQMWDEFYKGINIKVIGFPIWADYLNLNTFDLAEYPKWKVNFILKNQELYKKNWKFIDYWFSKYNQLEWCQKTHKKFEWQAGDKYSSIFECLIQFRPSGVRVKKPDKFSTLVAMNHRQIIGKYIRKITLNEAKKLMCFPDDFHLNQSLNTSFKQLGNSVNTNVIQQIFSIILKYYHEKS